MKMISLLLLISISTVHAATPKTRVPAPAPNAATNPIPAPPAPGAPVAANAVVAAPAAPPIPWKISYFGEYFGPRLNNFDLAKTQGPLDPASDYTGIGHALKLGYKITGDVVLGTQFRANTPFSPTGQFSWSDIRIYGSWAHMIDTADVDMQGVLEAELPSSTKSKNKGQLVRFNIKNNWTFKTALRNWNFSVLTYISPRFFENQKGKTDIYFALAPSIQLDLAADWAILAEGNFDFEHNFDYSYFDFLQSNPDSFNLGILYTLNAHIQLNPALTFYTADFTVPTLYFGLSASL